MPEMSEEDVRKAIEPLILEYFENNDSMEVLFTLQEMLPNLGARRWMVVTIAVELAMDHKPSHRFVYIWKNVSSAVCLQFG